jgi:hypothetical protein
MEDIKAFLREKLGANEKGERHSTFPGVGRLRLFEEPTDYAAFDARR